MSQPTCFLRLASASALLLAASLAQAQYSWIDTNGVRHFSDRPPPPSTPSNKILKQPRSVAPQPALSRATVSGPPDLPPGPAQAERKGPPTLAQQEAAYRDRVKQREEQDKKEAQESQRQRDAAERCKNALDVLRQSTSGARVAKYDARGERGFMTDEEKLAEGARARKILADCQ